MGKHNYISKHFIDTKKAVSGFSSGFSLFQVNKLINPLYFCVEVLYIYTFLNKYLTCCLIYTALYQTDVLR